MLAAAMLCTAAYVFAAAGPNVEKHTKEQILAYIGQAENNGITLASPLTFASEPSFTAPCAPGALSADTQASALGMLNEIRYIAGLSHNVASYNSYIELTQAGALTNYINDELTHYPVQPTGMNSSLYALGKEGCAKSNIAWSSAANVPITKTIVTGWMADEDANNLDSVGHRRWCLNPAMARTGFGAVTGDNGTYAAMYSMDNSGSSSVSKVVWPAQVMPTEYFNASYPWSISSSTAFPGGTSITLTRERDGKVWNFSPSSADGYFHYNTENCGLPYCLIFRPSQVGSYRDGDIFHV